MSIPQANITNTELSLLPKESLPTMYDLPSEDPEEDGVPNLYHLRQGNLLTNTCQPVDYYPEKLLAASDFNLYYDVHHTKWYKRPDWFLVIGVDSLYNKTEDRQSYLIWQEKISPLVVVELLSPGTAKEDLGEQAHKAELERDKEVEIKEQKAPNPKWEVYEKILKVPYYFVFSDITNKLRYFKLIKGEYQEQILPENSPIWIAELKLGLGLWFGTYNGVTRTWLRWLDSQGNWILTDNESAEKERLDKERERLAKQLALQEKEEEKLAKELAIQEKELAIQEKEQLKLQLKQVAQNLLNSGMNIEQVCAMTGLNSEDIISS